MRKSFQGYVVIRMISDVNRRVLRHPAWSDSLGERVCLGAVLASRVVVSEVVFQQMSSKTLDVFPSSGALFTHETRYFLTIKTDVGAIFRQFQLALIQSDQQRVCWCGGRVAPRTEESFLTPGVTTVFALARFN